MKTKANALQSKEKRGVLRLHESMLPGNSFPQICVVSGHIIEDRKKNAQEYFGAMAQSNRKFTIL